MSALVITNGCASLHCMQNRNARTIINGRVSSDCRWSSSCRGFSGCRGYCREPSDCRGSGRAINGRAIVENLEVVEDLVIVEDRVSVQRLAIAEELLTVQDIVIAENLVTTTTTYYCLCRVHYCTQCRNTRPIIDGRVSSWVLIIALDWCHWDLAIAYAFICRLNRYRTFYSLKVLKEGKEWEGICSWWTWSEVAQTGWNFFPS